MVEQAGQSTELARLVDESVKSGVEVSEEFFTKAAAELAKIFGVSSEDIAVLEFEAKGTSLKFLFPLRLRSIGAIPLTIIHSLAARTYKDKRPEIVNNFAAQKHPTIFESIKADKEIVEQFPIQKIMSVPLIVDNAAVGVIQISRRGKNQTTAGADFSIRDLTLLMSAAGTLSKAMRSAHQTARR